MAIPLDPFEVTIEKLIEADTTELEEWKAKESEIASKVAEVEARLEGYANTLTGYRKHRPINPSVEQAAPIANMYGDDANVAKELRGLTNTLQRLIKLGLMNNRRIKMNEAGRVLQRTGIMKGKWRNIPARLYATTKENPDVFKRIDPGVFEILPGAEKHLPYLPSGDESKMPIDSFTQKRVNIIATEATKHDNLIRHNQAVEALETAGYTTSAKQHAVNVLVKSGRFDKVEDGLYRLKTGNGHSASPNASFFDLQ